MGVLTEKLPHAGGFLISEGNGDISREAVTLARHSLTFRSGEVLGRVTVSRKYTHLDPGAEDGSETAAGILYRDVDAREADAEGAAIARLATVTAAHLVWPDGIVTDDKAAALAALAARHIIAR